MTHTKARRNEVGNGKEETFESFVPSCLRVRFPLIAYQETQAHHIRSASNLRGSMDADNFQDYMLSFLLLRYLSDNYETPANDLITAEIQKLEALKIHKKGLMQQLFPSPEQTA